MGRWGTYPTTVNSLRDLDIRFLTKYGYLKPDSFRSGVVTWTSGHGTKNSISIKVITGENYGTITVDYILNETENVNYEIRLITRPSNLGRGLLWFFVCPRTGAVCRKLHSINGYFMHRTAKPGLMYQKQIESKFYRYLDKNFSFGFIETPEEINPYQKHYKRYYKGKPTKRYLKYLQFNKKMDSVDLHEFELMMSRRFKGWKKL